MGYKFYIYTGLVDDIQFRIIWNIAEIDSENIFIHNKDI